MITKYAVLNPINGQYVKVDTKEDAQAIVIQNIVDLYKAHSHMYPISQINIDGDGNETWVADDNGTELPENYLNQIQNEIAK